MSQGVIAIDQGTTSTRAILFDADGRAAAVAQRELPQVFPADGWVEHDPEEIWRATVAVARAVADRRGGLRIAAIGITNQRETTVLWERASGRPIHNAIVWQDRRTADWCRRLKGEVGEDAVQRRTGLLFDPYFSASKIAWLLDNVAGARAGAERGELAFGTIDCFLLWRLTGGAAHATDATNASRTLLFNLATQAWDDDLLEAFAIPRAILPEVRDSAAAFGATARDLLGAPAPILGVAGDQQAAAIGQACVEPGAVKSTFGTGCFILLNTGERPLFSRQRLLTTQAYRIDGRSAFALEGSIFNAGTAVQWMRDRLKLFADAADTARLAASVADTGGVYLVPAFTGLGAPWWDPEARGLLAGITRDSGAAEIARAGLEATAYQTRDLIAAMAADGAGEPTAVRVDGGMAVNDWLMQFLADQLGIPVERPAATETTALGAACLAGLGAGLYSSLDDIAARWRCERRFAPAGDRAAHDRLYAGWRAAVRRALARA